MSNFLREVDMLAGGPLAVLCFKKGANRNEWHIECYDYSQLEYSSGGQRQRRPRTMGIMDRTTLMRMGHLCLKLAKLDDIAAVLKLEIPEVLMNEERPVQLETIKRLIKVMEKKVREKECGRPYWDSLSDYPEPGGTTQPYAKAALERGAGDAGARVDTTRDM